MPVNPRVKHKPTHDLDEVKNLLEIGKWHPSHQNAVVPAYTLYGLSKEGIKEAVLALAKVIFGSQRFIQEYCQEFWQDAYITNFEGHRIYIKLRIAEAQEIKAIIVSFHDSGEDQEF
ncbi:hypothetical protein MASR1M90_04460 [Desulfovibrionales bacterium]